MGQAENERKQVRFVVGINLCMALRRKESFRCQCFTAMATCIGKGGFRFYFFWEGSWHTIPLAAPSSHTHVLGFTESEGYGKVYNLGLLGLFRRFLLKTAFLCLQRLLLHSIQQNFYHLTMSF